MDGIWPAGAAAKNARPIERHRPGYNLSVADRETALGDADSSVGVAGATQCRSMPVTGSASARPVQATAALTAIAMHNRRTIGRAPYGGEVVVTP